MTTEPGTDAPGHEPFGVWLSSSDTYLDQFDVYGDHLWRYKPGRIFVDYESRRWVFYNNYGIVFLEGQTSGWNLLTELGTNMIVRNDGGPEAPWITLGWDFPFEDDQYSLVSYLWAYSGTDIPTERGSIEDYLPPAPPPVADYGWGWEPDGGSHEYCYHRVDASANNATGLELRYYRNTDSVVLRLNRGWTSGDPPFFRNGLGDNDHVIVLRGLASNPLLMPTSIGWVDTGDSRPTTNGLGYPISNPWFRRCWNSLGSGSSG